MVTSQYTASSDGGVYGYSDRTVAGAQSIGGMVPTSPGSFIFETHGGDIRANIYYQENYIDLNAGHQGLRYENVKISSINVVIPYVFKSKTLDEQIPYLRLAFVAIIDGIRTDVNSKWIAGELNGKTAMTEYFKSEIRTMFEIGFPGSKIGFGPRPVNVLPSVVVHSVL